MKNIIIFAGELFGVPPTSIDYNHGMQEAEQQKQAHRKEQSEANEKRQGSGIN